MKKILTIAAILLVTTNLTQADLFYQSKVFFKKTSLTYQGPGDVVSGASAWYGLRAYNAAYAASNGKLINIERSSDNGTCDVLAASSGGMGLTANCSSGGNNGETAATFCGTATCTATKLYDQSGNGITQTQSTVSQQATLTFNCVGSLPCLAFSTGSSQQYAGTFGAAIGQPYTATGVTERTGNTGAYTGLLTAGAVDLGNPWFVNEMYCSAANGSNINGDATDNIPHSLACVFNGTSSEAVTDAGVTTGNAGTGAFTTSSCIGSFCGSGYYNGYIMELGLWPSGFSNAQIVSMCGNQSAYWGLSGCYQGPGDLVAGATAWYGLRAYDGAVADTNGKLINITRSSDSSTCDVLSGTSGAMGLTANCSSGGNNGETPQTYCGTATCTANTIYDQTGNGNTVTQSTVVNQPTLTFSCLGALPCLVFNSTNNQQLSSTNTISDAVPYSFSWVAERTGNTSQYNCIFNMASGNVQVGFYDSANEILTYANGSIVGTAANDNVWHTVQQLINGTGSIINIDGSETSISPGTLTTTNTTIIGGGSSHELAGDFAEAGLWPLGFTSSNRSSVCDNQYKYWGTPNSC
jgi:hypothetical protein